jgi:hypothetical protein
MHMTFGDYKSRIQTDKDFLSKNLYSCDGCKVCDHCAFLGRYLHANEIRAVQRDEQLGTVYRKVKVNI